MPILGLTDTQSIAAAYPVIGKLRKGAEKPEKGPGRDLDHFRFTSDNPDVLAAFEAAYPTPESRRAINCLVVGESPEKVLDSWMEFRDATKLVRRCDGQSLETEYVNGRYVTYQGLSLDLRPPCKGCPNGNMPAGESCKPVGRMSVIIKELLEAGYVGRVAVETHSIHDLLQLPANLEQAEEDFGRVDRVPFVLRRVKTQVSTPRPNGVRAREWKWLLQLLPTAQWVLAQQQLASRRHYQQITGQVIDVESLPDLEESPALPALPSRGQAPHAETIQVKTLWNFYRSLSLPEQNYSQILRIDLQSLGKNPSDFSLINDADLPLLVGVRLGAVAAQSYPLLFGEDYDKGFELARQESGDWIRRSPELTERFKSRQYGAIGMAWLDYLDQCEADKKQAATEVAATV